MAPIWVHMNVWLRKMKNSLCLIFLLCLFIPAYSQEEVDNFSLLFYNVENLFDIQNDSLTQDDEFTPSGERHWSYKRFNDKLNNISKVILSAAGWKAPSIIAMVEIENRYVLEQLKNNTPLRTQSYKIIHKESPDLRGIDVALFYNPEEFYPLKYEYYPLKKVDGQILNSREILYVAGLLGGKDTLHIFVNHWPSRYSGFMETKDLRNAAASLLRSKVDQLILENVNVKLVIVGDFNDEPENESVSKYLKAQGIKNENYPDQLYNLSAGWKSGTGTLKYQGDWFTFDQIIVSGALLNSKQRLSVSPNDATICNFPFLLEEDKTYGGMKPFRTYTGLKYNRGFSDHLPVLLRINNY